MTDPLAPRTDGQTSLGPDDLEGLVLTDITTQAELNDAEQRSILRALAQRRAPTLDTLLDDAYLRRLHRDMFKGVWSWAGRYRTRETNIGLDPGEIPSALRNLVDDARLWLAETDRLDESCARFHHRLVQVHAFTNGNGRHARAAADLLLRARGARPFSWGAASATAAADVRRDYLHALRTADATGDLELLVEFARS